jgi:hypothetical protein
MIGKDGHCGGVSVAGVAARDAGEKTRPRACGAGLSLQLAAKCGALILLIGFFLLTQRPTPVTHVLHWWRH